MSNEMDDPMGYGAGAGDATGRSSFETLLSDVPLELSVELGRVTLSLRELASRLGPGSIVALTKLAGEKLDVRVNDRLVAHGEAVAVGERYGVRIVEIVTGNGKQS
jgi:flagellar motor switch protein FliN/FliY